MEKNTKLNEILVSLMNSVLKVEEQALKESTNVDLSITEIHTLEAIGIGKLKTMTQVAGSLKISVSTLTVAINRLVKKGYVDRCRIPEDRRIVKIGLTDAGISVVEEHQTFHTNMIKDITANMADSEIDVLLKSLEGLRDFFRMQLIKPVRSEGPMELKPMNMNGLEIPIPIFQGGMGIGVSMWKLAAAVAKCGGVGIISAAQPGYMEEDFYTDPLSANVRGIKREVELAVNAVKDVPGAGPIGINMMCVGRNYDEIIVAAVEAGAKVIVSGAGLPTSLPGVVKGKDVKLIPIVSSARAAALIIKSWARKHNRMPDGFVFEGPKAGGHLGFKEEQLEIADENYYKTIMEIKAEIASIPECKLIVGGGIFTRDDVEKALSYGADGVQVGTKFVATEECDAPESFKQAYVNCTKDDIAIIKSPVGMPGRAIKNKFVTNVAEKQEKQPIKRCNGCMTACNPRVAPYCITEALIAAASGDAENGLVFCGSNAYLVDKIVKVSDVFAELTGE
ncbi:nitronate monooxygenase [Aminipila sp.]|uniref:nitronate monooxygenase n=1 Tax=Aminipila sp. TaxID=2060095 RepID=UPI002F3EEA76